MSSLSSSSSATAGRLRWTRLRRRRRLIEWGAAALAAAALYLTPALLVGVLAGADWAIASFVACILVLVPYSFRLRSPLGAFVALVLVGFVEFVVQLGTGAAQVCGSSGLANHLEWSGSAVILVTLGGFGAYSRRVLPVLGAIVAAGVWVAIVAHLVPGGTGDCFH